MAAYTATVWVNNTAPAMSAANLNKLTNELESQAAARAVSHTLPNWTDGAAPAITEAAPWNEMERVCQAVALSLGYTYTPTVWQSGWTPARNQTRLNRLENQAVVNRSAIDSPPQTLSSPVGYLNYGNQGPSAHAADYKVLIGLPFRVAGAPGKALRYVSCMAATDGANYGVTYETALANGWLCTDASGPIIMPGMYRYIPRLDLAGYRQAWIAGVTAMVGTLDGYFCDDIQGYVQAVTGGRTPSQFPTEAAWYNAIVEFVNYVGAHFKGQGKYCAYNCTNLNQDTDGGNSNNGNRNKTMYAAITPGANGIMAEYWENHPAIPTADHSRPTGTDAWYKFWDNWRSITPQLNAVGVDFLPLHDGAGQAYGLCTFLLDWDGSHGCFIYSGGFTTDTNPWTSLYDQAKALGAPTAAATQTSAGVWRRQYANGVVNVNANTLTGSIT